MIAERQKSATGVAMGATPESMRINFAIPMRIDCIEAVNANQISQIKLAIGLHGTDNGVQVGAGIMEDSNMAINANGKWILSPDEEVVAWFEGTTANDKLYLTVHGQPLEIENPEIPVVAKNRPWWLL